MSKLFLISIIASTLGFLPILFLTIKDMFECSSFRTSEYVIKMSLYAITVALWAFLKVYLLGAVIIWMVN